MNIKDKKVLLTGGSSGIGFATAAALLAKGAKVVVTGRREDVLHSAIESLRAGGGDVEGVAADIATEAGRALTLESASTWLGGIDILINNAGGVRAGRLEDTSEAAIRAMIDVNLVAPIFLTRAALPILRASGDGLVVNVSSGIALIGMPFYTTYAAVKAGVAHFGEALRREMKGEGVGVVTVYPGATDTPMMMSSRAGPEVGFMRESASAVAEAIVDGIETGALRVIRGGETRAAMIAQNWSDPVALDERFAAMKGRFGDAVRDHDAL